MTTLSSSCTIDKKRAISTKVWLPHPKFTVFYGAALYKFLLLAWKLLELLIQYCITVYSINWRKFAVSPTTSSRVGLYGEGNAGRAMSQAWRAMGDHRFGMREFPGSNPGGSPLAFGKSQFQMRDYLHHVEVGLDFKNLHVQVVQNQMLWCAIYKVFLSEGLRYYLLVTVLTVSWWRILKDSKSFLLTIWSLNLWSASCLATFDDDTWLGFALFNKSKSKSYRRSKFPYQLARDSPWQ